MAFKIRIGTVEIECDTADEALAIAKGISSGERTSPLHQSASNGHFRNTAAVGKSGKHHDLVAYLNVEQQKVLQTILQNPDGQTDRSLCERFNLGGNNALGGMLGGISKRLSSAGIDFHSLVFISKVLQNGHRTHLYRPTDHFRQIAKDLGW